MISYSRFYCHDVQRLDRTIPGSTGLSGLLTIRSLITTYILPTLLVKREQRTKFDPLK